MVCEQKLLKGEGPKTSWTRELTNDGELILVSPTSSRLIENLGPPLGTLGRLEDARVSKSHQARAGSIVQWNSTCLANARS